MSNHRDQGIQTIMVSKAHLSGLHQLIHTQHQLLKMRLVGTPEAKEIKELFEKWRHMNGQLSSIYQNLELGTIVLEDKLSQQKKEKALHQRIKEIEQILHNINIEKGSLESTVESYKRQCSQQVATISLQSADLNRLSSQKQFSSDKIKQLKDKIKELRDTEQVGKSYRKQAKMYKEKADTLEQKCLLLQKMQYHTQDEIGEELDRELESLEGMLQ